MSPEVAAFIMLGGLVVGVLFGYPLAIPIGGVSLIVGYLLFGNRVFDILYTRSFDIINNYVLLAIPLFVFMGVMLESSGIADRLYEALYLWLGRIRGGLAITTMLLGTILAACVGTIGASITMLSLIAMPAMVKRGYDKSLAAGTVCAAGCLGILIPPSVMLVIYGPMAGISVGKLFFGAFGPGFTLSALYMIYIAITCFLQPELGPVPHRSEIAVPFATKLKALLTSLAPTALLVLAVLGAIFFGIAPPTEAAAVGAVFATLLTIAYRKFSIKVLRETAVQTMRVTSMILLIAAVSFAFVGVFINAGSGEVVKRLVVSAPGGTWGVFAVVMFIFFILGFFMDWIGILFIMVPIISPIASALQFDPLWFAIIICVNFQAGFMTPPFAPAIFYLRGTVAPELGVTMSGIIRGVWPFVGLILVTIGLCIAFPEIILWLPGMMIK